MITILVFLLALLISSIGFIMYVYFFSVGYGFAIAGISALLLFLFRQHLTISTVIMSVLLILYGIRLGGYLLYREMKSTGYKNLLKNETKTNVPMIAKVSIWISCAILYFCMTSPLLFRYENSARDDVPSYVGIVFMVLGIAIEALADIQKSNAKKVNPHSFVSTGLYRIVRCPNYFGELLLWTGVFITGISVFATPLQWVVAILGYIGIVYVMFSGARRLEIRQDRNYGDMEDYKKYIKTTPIIIPLIPIYSVKKHKWLVA